MYTVGNLVFVCGCLIQTLGLLYFGGRGSFGWFSVGGGHFDGCVWNKLRFIQIEVGLFKLRSVYSN